MNRNELISEIANRTGLTKKASGYALNIATEAIMREVSQGNKVQIIGFGTFESRDRQERKGRNPQTGKPITIEAKKVPVFKPGAEFKNMLK